MLQALELTAKRFVVLWQSIRGLSIGLKKILSSSSRSKSVRMRLPIRAKDPYRVMNWGDRLFANYSGGLFFFFRSVRLQVRACVALMALNDEGGLLDALGWLEGDEQERGKVDKAEFVQIRMKVRLFQVLILLRRCV